MVSPAKGLAQEGLYPTAALREFIASLPPIIEACDEASSEPLASISVPAERSAVSVPAISGASRTRLGKRPLSPALQSLVLDTFPEDLHLSASYHAGRAQSPSSRAVQSRVGDISRFSESPHEGPRLVPILEDDDAEGSALRQGPASGGARSPCGKDAGHQGWTDSLLGAKASTPLARRVSASLASQVRIGGSHARSKRCEQSLLQARTMDRFPSYPVEEAAKRHRALPTIPESAAVRQHSIACGGVEKKQGEAACLVNGAGVGKALLA